VFGHQAQHRLAFLQRLGEHRFGAEGIVRADYGAAGGGSVFAHQPVMGVDAVPHPAAAMDIEQHRVRPRPVRHMHPALDAAAAHRQPAVAAFGQHRAAFGQRHVQRLGQRARPVEWQFQADRRLRGGALLHPLVEGVHFRVHTLVHALAPLSGPAPVESATARPARGYGCRSAPPASWCTAQ
jgi:hypothetical protein